MIMINEKIMRHTIPILILSALLVYVVAHEKLVGWEIVAVVFLFWLGFVLGEIVYEKIRWARDPLRRVPGISDAREAIKRKYIDVPKSPRDLTLFQVSLVTAISLMDERVAKLDSGYKEIDYAVLCMAGLIENIEEQRMWVYATYTITPLGLEWLEELQFVLESRQYR